MGPWGGGGGGWGGGGGLCGGLGMEWPGGGGGGGDKYGYRLCFRVMGLGEWCGGGERVRV